MSETATAPVAAPAASPAPVSSDAIRQAIEGLRSALPQIEQANPAFANGIRSLLERADDPVQLNKADFQHRIAYAVADTQAGFGPLRGLEAGAQERLRELSISAPGLTSDRALLLLSEVRTFQDASLRRDIRRTAIEIGRQADQDTPQIVSQLEALENRVRLSSPTPATKPAQGTGPTGQDGQTLAAGLDAAGRPASSGQSADAQPGKADTSATRAETNRTTTEPQQAPQAQANQVGTVQAGAGAAVVSAMLRGFQKLGEAVPPPPWEAMTTNFGERLKAFEDRRQAASDQKVIAGLEQSGANALSALQSFTNNEGAVMMNRINQAARSDPNGVEGVLADMRPGGKYAGLRQQFNGAINDEKGFAAAYDKAVEAVGQYAYDRKASAPIVARSADAPAVTARLVALEQNVGERMAGIPSLSDGKTMLEDLRKQAAEVFKAVADGIKNLFQRAGASPSPSP